MDQDGVDIQILSMTVPSGIECLDNPDATLLARDANDELSSAIKANSGQALKVLQQLIPMILYLELKN